MIEDRGQGVWQDSTRSPIPIPSLVLSISLTHSPLPRVLFAASDVERLPRLDLDSSEVVAGRALGEDKPAPNARSGSGSSLSAQIHCSRGAESLVGEEGLNWGKVWDGNIKFFFFTFLGNPPLKSSNPKCDRCAHPHTMNITPLCPSHDILQSGGGFIVIG